MHAQQRVGALAGMVEIVQRIILEHILKTAP